MSAGRWIEMTGERVELKVTGTVYAPVAEGESREDALHRAYMAILTAELAANVDGRVRMHLGGGTEESHEG
jgi:hypothetical protein